MAADDQQVQIELPQKKELEPPPPDEGIPPWMATFADMVTLLLCFFVLLLSFTSQDINNFKILMGAIQEAMGVQMEDMTATNVPYAQTKLKFEDRQEKSRQIVEIGARLREYIRAEDLSKTSRVSDEKSGVMLRVSNAALFPRGSASIAPKQAAIVLGGVVETLHKHPEFNCVIRGHTDGDVAESTIYDSNWELSAARAAACLRWIIKNSDIKADRLKAVGYASSKPILPSTTAVNRQLNRRVDFFILPNTYRTW